MNTLIVMMAPSSAGKSTLAHYIEETHDDCVIVSRDKIRFSMLSDGEDYFAHEDEVISTFYSRINEMLKIHEYVIADATHISKKARKELFRNVRTKDVRVVGVWIDIPMTTAIKRNESRIGRSKVPEDVIRRMFKYKVPPVKEEGFDEIVYVSNEYAIGSTAPYLDGIFEKLKNI